MYIEIEDDELRISDLGERMVSIEDEDKNELVLVRDRNSGKFKLFVQNSSDEDRDVPTFCVDMESERIIEEE